MSRARSRGGAGGGATFYFFLPIASACRPPLWPTAVRYWALRKAECRGSLDSARDKFRPDPPKPKDDVLELAPSMGLVHLTPVQSVPPRRPPWLKVRVPGEASPRAGSASMRLIWLVGVALSSHLLLMASDGQRDETKKPVRVGQLEVTPLAAGTVQPGAAWGLKKPPKRDYHYVVVTIRVKNVSEYPNCTHFHASLLTNSRRTYRAAIWRAPDPPEVERLPWQAESIGSYSFQVRDGEEPSALVLERNFLIERECWRRHDFSPDAPYSTKVHVPLEGLSSPEEREPPPATGEK